jgi:hypothetical protein
MAGALGPLHSDLAAFGRVLATASVDALNRVADLLRHSWPHEDPQPALPGAGGNAFLASSAHIPARFRFSMRHIRRAAAALAVAAAPFQLNSVASIVRLWRYELARALQDALFPFLPLPSPSDDAANAEVLCCYSEMRSISTHTHLRNHLFHPNTKFR